MQAFCRGGPDTEFEPLMILQAGKKARLLGVNPARTWGEIEVLVDFKPLKCWMAYDMVELNLEEEVKLVEVPPMPIATQKPGGPGGSSFSCTNYKTEEKRIADIRCDWTFRTGHYTAKIN